jgi:hypothetical protein
LRNGDFIIDFPLNFQFFSVDDFHGLDAEFLGSRKRNIEDSSLTRSMSISKPPIPLTPGEINLHDKKYLHAKLIIIDLLC